MRLKYISPSGSGVLELPDCATLNTLFDEIAVKTGLTGFTLKYGPPTAMKSLDHRHRRETAQSLNLNRETFIVVPEEQPHDSSASQARGPMPSTGSIAPSEEAEELAIPWAEREGTVFLRVMPSDNSCLFTAFGGALPNQIPAQRLRQMIADYINEHHDVYSEAVLGSSRAAYCQSIQNPDRWGGGIELSILSSIFDIQISTFDVQAQKLIQFGELKKDRCILVFSGIHYDRVVFSYSEYPHLQTTLPPEMDCTVWPVDDADILDKARALVEKLHIAHYYTDTEGLILKCDVPGCDWIGSGQAAGQRHAEKTGHIEMTEVRDVPQDNVLRRCEVFGCTFMGQGDKATKQHVGDTGHDRFSIIPDL